MKVRVRFGIKRVIPLLPNAGIVVVRMDDIQFQTLRAAVDTINLLGLAVPGMPTLICEES